MIAPGPPAAAVKRGARQTQAPGEAMELLVAVGEQVAPHTSAPLEHQLVHIDGHGADRDMTQASWRAGWGGTRAAAGSADSRLASADRDRHALLVIAIDQGQHVATADRPPGHQLGGRARGVHRAPAAEAAVTRALLRLLKVSLQVTFFRLTLRMLSFVGSGAGRTLGPPEPPPAIEALTLVSIRWLFGNRISPRGGALRAGTLPLPAALHPLDSSGSPS